MPADKAQVGIEGHPAVRPCMVYIADELDYKWAQVSTQLRSDSAVLTWLKWYDCNNNLTAEKAAAQQAGRQHSCRFTL